VGQVFGGGSQYVWLAGKQVDAAITIGVQAMLQIISGQELGLAQFSSPGTFHLLFAQIALVQNPQGGDELGPEQLRSAAVMCQGGQGTYGIKAAGVGTKVGFQGPEGDYHRGWNPIL